MALGLINHPSYQTGLTSSDTWVNQIFNFLSYFAIPTADPLIITSAPTTVIQGKPYLIGSGSTYGTPGDIVIFLSTALSSSINATPPVGFNYKNFTKTASSWNYVAPSGGGGSLNPWVLKTTDYTAVAGDRILVDCTSGNKIITLPASPISTDADITIQRVDASNFSLTVNPNGLKIKGSLNSGTLTGLGKTEILNYTGYSSVGWIGSLENLVPAVTTDPLFSSVSLLLPLTSASGITDVKGKTTSNNGTSISVSVLDPFGNNTGVAYFQGNGSSILSPQSSDFAFGNGAFAIEMWLYPTVFPSGTIWGILDVRSTLSAVPYAIYSNPSGNVTFYQPPVNDEPTTAALAINNWNYLCISRGTTGNHEISINGVKLSATQLNSNLTAPGQLTIGDILPSASPFDGSFTGYMSNFRITKAYRDGSVVPAAPFPTS